MKLHTIKTRTGAGFFKGLALALLFLTALFFNACSGGQPPKGDAPEWSKKTNWKEGRNLFAVGVHSGHFVNERDAYFAALRELDLFLDSSLDTPGQEGQSGLDRTGVVTCRSAKQEYATEGEDPSDQSPSGPIQPVETSEEFYSEYSESEAGVYVRYLLSAFGGAFNMELGYDCSTNNINKTLITIPLIDSYFVKKGETVTTYVLIQYDETLLKQEAAKPE